MYRIRYFLLAGFFAFVLISCSSTKNFDADDISILEEEQAPERYVYKHVIIVGIDGAGSFQEKCSTPNMDSIFSEGIWTPNCIASLPSISAQCWGSMFTGVAPSVHKLNNQNVGMGKPYDNPVYPTFFKLARETDPSAKLAAFCGWRLICEGMIEPDIGVVTDTGSDAEIAEKVSAFIKTEKPDLMFVQFDSVDHAGHTLGFGKKEYVKALEAVDGYVGKIFEAVKEAGILDDTLFILTSDHGGVLRGHGGISRSEMDVYFGAAGKTVKKSTTLKLKGRDLAAIVCQALNLKTNENWASKVPKDFFSEY